MRREQNGSTEWRSALDEKSGRTYYYKASSGETTWSKPVELATGEEREEIIRKKLETKNFFAAMEATVRRKFATNSGWVVGDVPLNSGWGKSESKSDGELSSMVDDVKSCRSQSRDVSSDSKAETKDIGYFLEDITADGAKVSCSSGTKAAGRLVRTISSLDDEILTMSLTQDRTRSISTSSRGNDDFMVGMDKSVALSPARENFLASIGSPRNNRSRSPRHTVSVVPSAKNAPKGMLRRNNSMSTIFVDTTLVKPNNERTIKCVCHVLRMHMKEYNDMDPCTAFPKSDIFSDDRSYPADAAASPSKSKFVPTPASNLPSLETVTAFFSLVFFKTQMEDECIIIALIYCERLLIMTEGTLRIHGSNWRSVIFASLIMASKVWDDLSMWNVDFSNVFASSFDLRRINELELAMLDALQYNVKVKAGEYAKYYFHLRSMMAHLGYYKDSLLPDLQPLDMLSARKLQLNTQRFHDESEPMRRSISVPKNIFDLEHSKPRAGSEESYVTFPERSALVGVEQLMRQGL